MKRTVLFILTAILGFPIFSLTALVETELTYKVRNARGVQTFGTYHNGVGQVNLVNGNLMLKRNLFERPGTAGFDLDLSLYYNSKIWDRNATNMYVRWGDSKVGLGWSLGFPKLQQGTSTYALIYPDGSTHELQQYADGTWRSVDSTYIRFDPATNTVTFKGGTQLKFGYPATTMKDSNGNLLTAQRHPSINRLEYVRDTTGIAARFYYDEAGFLISIQSYGRSYAEIKLTYESAYLGPVTPNPFSLPMQQKTGEKYLTAITRVLPDHDVVERFVYYYGTGELHAISEETILKPSNEQIVNGGAQFQYTTRSFSDATYATADERVLSSIFDGFGNTTFAYTINGNSTNPSQTTVTDTRYPSNGTNGVTIYNFFSSVYPARSWSDGLVSSVQRKNPGQTTTYRTITTEWEQDTSASYIVNPRPFRQTVTLDDGKTIKKEIVYSTDGTGNIKQILEYKFGGTELLRSTTTDYLHETNSDYATRGLTNLPTAVSVRDANGTEVSRTEYAYDEFPLNNVGAPTDWDISYINITLRGLQTSIKRKYLEQNRYLTTTIKYDNVGRIASITDPKGGTSSRTYVSPDKYWDYNALGQGIFTQLSQYGIAIEEGSQIYEYFFNGNIASVWDLNRKWTFNYYDELGRNTLTTQSGTDSVSNSYDDFNLRNTRMSGSERTIHQKNIYGATTKEAKYDPAGADIVTTASYNNPGQQPSSVSLPYREGATPTNITYTYDPIGRKTSEAVPGVGTTYYYYAGNNSTVIYPDNKSKHYYYEESGQLVYTISGDGNGNYFDDASYYYDVLGRLILIAKWGRDSMPHQFRTFTYDSLGRLTSETHPEKGTTSFTYDDNGNVLTKTDARGVIATFTYDALNRQRSVSYSDGSPSATYTYDEASSGLIGVITYGIGKMTSAWTSDGIGYSWSYDDLGRVTTQVASIDGTQYPVSYSYTEAGCSCSKKSLRRITYPDATTVDYQRDSIERVSKIYTDPASPYAQYTYNSPVGGMSDIQFGDSIADHFVFDSLGRLKEQHMHKPGGYQSEWLYSFNASSQINAIEEHIHQASSTYAKYEYTYDSLMRLASASHRTGSSPTSWNAVDQINGFSYDLYGNMLTNQLQYPSNPSLNTQTTFSVNPADNRLNSYTNAQGTTTTLYDPAGNMTQEGTKTYSYNGAGRMASVGGSNSGTYRYDALGQRIKKTYTYTSQSGTISGSIISVYGTGGALLVEYKTETGPTGSNNSRTNYIVNGSQAVARRIIPESGSASTEFLHRNHLSQVVKPSDFSVGFGASSMYGMPFGSGGNDQFAGHKDDPESGLHYNLARSYDSSLSRWQSGDPITTHIFDPQSLNKYTYIRNNPINGNDIDGRDVTQEITVYGYALPSYSEIMMFAFLLDYARADLWLALNQYLAQMAQLPPPAGAGNSTSWDQKTNDEIAKVKNKLDPKNIKPTCLTNFFGKLPSGLTPEWLRNNIDKYDIKNPYKDNSTIDSLMGTAFAVAQKISGWTVSQLFEKGFPLDPKTKMFAWSPYGTDFIYITPDYNNGKTIAHEVLHKFSAYLDDGWLMKQLGLTGGSYKISDEFGKYCL